LHIPDTILSLYFFIVGSCIGSFVNVCIYRLPRSLSIVFPGSSCPQCESRIRFYDNIPILSFLWLRGKCRNCGASIPFRYVLIEGMTGFFAVCTYLKFGLSVEALVYFCFIATLLVVIYIDIDHQIIPNRITFPGIPVCLAATFFLPGITFAGGLAGMLAGGGSLFIVAWSYKQITKREGMGFGDIKLLAMIGALIGWKGVLFTIYLASVLGTAVGLLVILLNKKNFRVKIPFGPFLSIGAITFLFFGDEVIAWYFHTF